MAPAHTRCALFHHHRWAWLGGLMHEYLVMGLVAIAAVILANMFFPRLPFASGLVKYL